MPVMRDGVGHGRLYGPPPPASMAVAKPAAVKIEAQFSVGEYDIVVLSATDATALDTWLRQNNYKIPAGAEPYLRPYVQMGMKFFVAKVNIAKVRFERIGNGPEQAILSPIRFHYDSDAFNLPIRLGLINSAGTQDLVVTILARNQRYEVANYDNVAIPTNIDVSDATRKYERGLRQLRDTLHTICPVRQLQCDNRAVGRKREVGDSCSAACCDRRRSSRSRGIPGL
jgi:hypothetical protein